MSTIPCWTTIESLLTSSSIWQIASGKITSGLVKDYLMEQGARLRRKGEEVYYQIREEFNREPNSLAFLFLNRACFNGVMRFNRKGKFNVPFCRKPERFT